MADKQRTAKAKPKRGANASEAANALVKQRGPDYFRKLGRKGGSTTKRIYGDEHYAEMGRKGGRATAQLIAEAKAARDNGRV